LVGVVFADTSANARAFMESFGADWPVVADPSGRIALAYGVRGPPETFIIAPDGLVIAHIDGPVSASYLTSLIARARSLHA
jgi:cytochrome c biogenesis protein CcmG/thiol:disulfide interchange protein DsbE